MQETVLPDPVEITVNRMGLKFYQWIAQAAVGIAVAIISFILVRMWDSLDNVKTLQTSTTERTAKLEIYAEVNKERLTRLETKIDLVLERLVNKDTLKRDGSSIAEVVK